MTVNIETLSSNRCKLLCSVSAEEKTAEQNKVILKVMKDSNIPGFRKGKAPRASVLNFYADKINNDTINNLIQSTYENAVKEQNLDVYELISISNVDSTTEQNGMSFEATVDLTPAFELPEYEGIPIDNKTTVVTDEEVDAEFEKFRKQMGSFKDIGPDAVAEHDDMLNIAFKGTINGKPLEEEIPDTAIYASREESWCTVGSEHYMIPGLQNAVMGMKVGDENTYNITFTEDFYKESLRGITVEYKVKVKEARRLTPPDIDDEFLKHLKIADVQELKGSIRKQLERRAQVDDSSRQANQLLEYLFKSTSFDLPQAALERNVEDELNRLLQYYIQSGTSRDDISKYREQLMDVAKSNAEKRLRTDFIIGKVGTKMNVELEDDEFKAFLMNYFSENRFGDAEAKELFKDKNRLRQLRDAAIKTKIVRILHSKAKPVDNFPS